MSVELTPLGVACNLSCTYCYQTPLRDAGNIGNDTPYDMDKMLGALEKEGAAFTVFGGEPLLVPLRDLRKIFAWGYARYKSNGIQTNGVLITQEHIEVFKEYNVHVGFSLDGPDELNDSRWAGTLEKTREGTRKSHANLRACVEAGVGTSVITTLYKGNATVDRLPRLMEWIREMDELGVNGMRIHMLEVDHAIVRARMQLSQEDTITALLELVAFEGTLRRIRFDILTDMRNLLRARDEAVTCIWNPCDPYTTSAVRGIDGQGNGSNCGRTNKDGILRLKAEQQGYERQIALYHTPQEHGGCAGCRFFLMCKGNCPGHAEDGDWRNRSADCAIWMRLFERLESEMVSAGELPLSLDAPTRSQVEQLMLQIWMRGEHCSLRAALEHVKAGRPGLPYGQMMVTGGHGDSHGDHTDVRGQAHGDVPHGDSHGDHTDARRVEVTA